MRTIWDKKNGGYWYPSPHLPGAWMFQFGCTINPVGLKEDLEAGKINKRSVRKMSRELDFEIHSKVMGFSIGTDVKSKSWQDAYSIYDNTFYSTQIQDAWLVVDKMLENNFLLSICAGHSVSGLIEVMFTENKPSPKRDATSNEEAVPLAICRAALMAVSK